MAGNPLSAPSGPIDTARVSAAYRGYIGLDKRLADVVATAITTARDEAQHTASSERAGYLTWTLGIAALAVVSLGFALRLARSSSKPLKALSAYARAVNMGRLDLAPPSASRNHGPREIRVVSNIVTDLVENLRLFDAKTNALAHCRFDDPVLHEPLPGRLGQSLESSVALLSGSIVERDQLQADLSHQATHDPLTEIGNRSAAISAIQAAMDRAARIGATIAVLFVDLNGFKAVNDSHGHDVGDEVLRRVACRITSDLRSGDFVARLGGDEFVLVAEGVADVADATYLARRVIDAISQPIEIGDLHISIGASVGVALALDGPEEPLGLLARADTAMYRAKQHDRSGVEIFDADLQKQLLEREDIEAALTVALADPTGGGLQLHYQPVLNTATRALVGVEALIRWDRPGHGLLSPDSFIPIAEATALIVDVDRWVLGEAVRQLVAWSTDALLPRLPVSVNISGRHLLSRQLPEHIRAVLDDAGLETDRLNIEITETVLLTDLVSAGSELDAVRALGINVAIDDFGTGYTSLAHLQQLPIDTIKIDRSYTREVNRQRGDSLMRMITDLGHALDINVVAEGVETADELERLQRIGVDQVQGFLFSRPLRPDALAIWAHEHGVRAPQLSP